ncbi:MAG: hypothetical protein ABIP55_05780, partial [Tepidisphaeraceae bacterium]
TWADVRQESPVQGEAWDMMSTHAWSNAFGSVALLLMAVLWLGSSDLWRARLHALYLLILLAGLGAIVYGAWFGGEMIYQHGVGVQAADATVETPDLSDLKYKIAYFASPLQVHVILAGSAISLALAALGLSLRAGAQVNVVVSPTPELSDIGMVLNPNARSADARYGSPLSVPSTSMNQLDDATMRVDVVGRPKAGRFWLLAALLALLAIATGWWTMAVFADTWAIGDLWQMAADTETAGWRRLIHVVIGVGIVAVLLALAVLSRIAAGRRMVLSLFATLLIVAVVFQVWFGSLLMFDSPNGPLGSFNGAVEAVDDAEPTPPPTTAPATTTTAPSTATVE